MDFIQILLGLRSGLVEPQGSRDVLLGRNRPILDFSSDHGVPLR
jgi:hypothetical protein